MNSKINTEIHDSICPACAHHIAVNFFPHFEQPLATLGWPRSKAEAQSMEKFSLRFIRCVNCGHVYNMDFKYQNVPYSQKPNLMYNQSPNWQNHLSRIRHYLNQYLFEEPIVVDIGCGDASFLISLAEEYQQGAFYGFDPHSHKSLSEVKNVKVFNTIFEPEIHLEECMPTLITIRHVLEHLKHPLTFLQKLDYVSSVLKINPYLFLEVPCIDDVFISQRTVDFYYEHPSHFTSNSFKVLLSKCSEEIVLVEKDYNQEVIFALVKLGRNSLNYSTQALKYYHQIEHSKSNIQSQLSQLLKSGHSIAIWGGTGKSAAFINHYGLEPESYPIVVDSDQHKVGTFVPGQGQEIKSTEFLLGNPVDIIIIPPQWRARDIVEEIALKSIQVKDILIEFQGKLISFEHSEHPYNF